MNASRKHRLGKWAIVANKDPFLGAHRQAIACHVATPAPRIEIRLICWSAAIMSAISIGPNMSSITLTGVIFGVTQKFHKDAPLWRNGFHPLFDSTWEKLSVIRKLPETSLFVPGKPVNGENQAV
jgi:hypothetical protein